LLPFAEGMEADSEEVVFQWTHRTSMFSDSLSFPGMGWSWLHEGTTGKLANGHGRTSRNRKTAVKGTQGDNSQDNGVEVFSLSKNALGRHNGAKRQHVAVTLEHKTDAAKALREKRNLANAVAMPTPTITGAELLARGLQLAIVPKPLTRFLESRKRRAA
jgi:hypothetical protein